MGGGSDIICGRDTKNSTSPFIMHGLERRRHFHIRLVYYGSFCLTPVVVVDMTHDIIDTS